MWTVARSTVYYFAPVGWVANYEEIVQVQLSIRDINRSHSSAALIKLLRQSQRMIALSDPSPFEGAAFPSSEAVLFSVMPVPPLRTVRSRF